MAGCLLDRALLGGPAHREHLGGQLRRGRSHARGHNRRHRRAGRLARRRGCGEAPVAAHPAEGGQGEQRSNRGVRHRRLRSPHRHGHAHGSQHRAPADGLCPAAHRAAPDFGGRHNAELHRNRAQLRRDPAVRRCRDYALRLRHSGRERRPHHRRQDNRHRRQLHQHDREERLGQREDRA